jgi:parallel beta-helix repeat protein
LSRSTSIRGTVVERNHVELVAAKNGHGIRLISYPNARIIDNTIIQTTADGIHVHASDDVELLRNRIELAGGHAMSIGPVVRRVVIDGNLISDWGATAPALLLKGAVYGIVRNNVLKRSDKALTPSFVVQDSCGVEIAGNYSLYPGPAINGSTAACPDPR